MHGDLRGDVELKHLEHKHGDYLMAKCDLHYLHVSAFWKVWLTRFVRMQSYLRTLPLYTN
jgi:hypothetical protein